MLSQNARRFQAHARTGEMPKRGGGPAQSIAGRQLPARLAYITVAGGTMFSALSGSSMANTAMLGSLLVPEMQQRDYKK
jgi:TRAP-type C4-dicarboxylate transport system permease large subunit